MKSRFFPKTLSALTALLLIPLTATAMGPMGPGAMGVSIAGPKPQLVPWRVARQALQSAQHQGQALGKTIVFHGKTARITVVANAPHHPDMSFDIDGLTNPTLSVASGSQVIVTFVNMDYGPGMVHGFVITATRPPYPTRVAQHISKVLVRAQRLPPRTRSRLSKALYAKTIVRFVARKPGQYYYLCPVPDHAQAFRMYGMFIVRSPT